MKIYYNVTGEQRKELVKAIGAILQVKPVYMRLTLAGQLAHGGHPVLRWMMDNIFIRTDPAGNIKPDKEKSTEKIDGAVATIMALDRAQRVGITGGTSIYDERGILSF